MKLDSKDQVNSTNAIAVYSVKDRIPGYIDFVNAVALIEVSPEIVNFTFENNGESFSGKFFNFRQYSLEKKTDFFEVKVNETSKFTRDWEDDGINSSAQFNLYSKLSNLYELDQFALYCNFKFYFFIFWKWQVFFTTSNF